MRILDRLLGARPLATVAIEFFDDGRSSVRIEHRGVEPDLELDVDVSLFCWYYAFVLFLVSKEPEVALALCGEVRTGSEEIVKAQAHAANRPSVADCTLIDDAPGPAIAVLSATVFEWRNGALYLNPVSPLAFLKQSQFWERSVLNLLQKLTDSLPDVGVLYLAAAIANMHSAYSEGASWGDQGNTNKIPAAAVAAANEYLAGQLPSDEGP